MCQWLIEVYIEKYHVVSHYGMYGVLVNVSHGHVN